MKISKEAVEVAARELNIYATPWEDLEQEQRDGWRSQAHAALRAAAPLLVASELRDLWAWSEAKSPLIGLMDLKYHIEKRADELEGKS